MATNVSNFPGGFSSGVNIRGIPVLNSYTGNTFWVRSTLGSDSNPGTHDQPFATIDYAIGRCVASRGDIIFVKHGHAETVTASITMDVAGVAIVGLGGPALMPTITGNFAGDAITITAANCAVANIRFAAPLTTLQTADINVDAAGAVIYNTYHLGSVATETKVDFITLTANATDCLIDGMRAWNTVVEMTGGGIKLEGACARVEIRNCCILDTIGLALGAIYDTATATAVYVHDCVFQQAKVTTVCAEFGNNTTGIFSYNHVSSRHATIATNITAGTGMDFYETYVTNEVSKNGLLIPAADVD